ncbi:MAG: 3-phosphoshikimate 1-carboxyvinyltransferase [Magnetococcales bacterium]|nr:3-phosphoshikimate 1-carboxyvinyltransferase [Magnetococcales bacterium]
MNSPPPPSQLMSEASPPLQGSVALPGDKSISHRAMILGSIAQGVTETENLLEGEDVLATKSAMMAMGVEIERLSPGQWRIHGKGMDSLAEPNQVLDVGNSGTSMRLLAGLLASHNFFSILTGDDSLRRRPMGRIIQPLTRMGAKILGREGGRLAPLAIQGTELVPIHYQSPVASAQIKSAILLAGLNTPGETLVTEPSLSRDHTERMLTAFGAEIGRDGLTVKVDGWPTLHGQKVVVPGDISSAAFPMVAATLVKDSQVILEKVGINPTRTGILDILTAMGAQITLANRHISGGEEMADLHIQYAPLKGIEMGGDVVARAIDEFPILFIAAALAEGTTRVRDAAELRVKESDRIAVMAQGLHQIGVQVEELPDGMVIHGQGGLLPGGATVDSHTDHRIAMSFLVAGLVSRQPVQVTRCANIATSFPSFVTLMNTLNAPIRAVEGS